MDLLEMICKELGIEIGEVWLGNDGRKYKITEDGRIKVWENEEWLQAFYNLGHLVTKELRVVWEPKKGEIYYVPNPTHLAEMNRFEIMVWDNDLYDEWTLENNLIFKTKEEAIKYANKMLKAVREE